MPGGIQTPRPSHQLKESRSHGTATDEHAPPRVLGRGRSGIVYLERDTLGRKWATKVFDSHGLTKLVQLVFLGTPNPYIWNEDAVRCALLRRRILARLVPVWFGKRMKVATSRGYRWNDEALAYELRTSFCPGRAPRLRSPFHKRENDEVQELSDELLPKLRAHLREAGFDGQLWQAGLGNPVALNNFLLEPGRKPADRTWTWIDLESGVPAYASVSPFAWLGFYLPATFKFRRALFDDIDVPRLEAYVAEHAAELEEQLGAHQLGRMNADITALAEHQNEWRSMSRLEGALAYRMRRGKITPTQADEFRRSPIQWYWKEGTRVLRGIRKRVGNTLGRIGKRLGALRPGRISSTVFRFVTSLDFREEVARHYVIQRVCHWRRRKQLTSDEAQFLRESASERQSSTFLTDFGVHMAIKPIAKAIQWLALPALFTAGWIDERALAIGLVTTGPLLRTIYSAGRTAVCLTRGQRAPWVALVTGTVPILGNFAYLFQILYRSMDEEGHLARFLLFDAFARVGRNIPIWGGQDTGTEHFFNRLPDGFALVYSKPLQEAATGSHD